MALVPGGEYAGVYTLQDGATGTVDGDDLNLWTSELGAATVVDIQLVGLTAGSATVTFRHTIDGTNWEDVRLENLETGAVSTTATVDGCYRYLPGAMVGFRVPVTTYSSGTIYAYVGRVA